MGRRREVEREREGIEEKGGSGGRVEARQGASLHSERAKVLESGRLSQSEYDISEIGKDSAHIPWFSYQLHRRRTEDRERTKEQRLVGYSRLSD